MRRHKLTPIKIQHKRFFRRIRTKLKKRLKRGGKLSVYLLTRYHLIGFTQSYQFFHRPTAYQKILIPVKFDLIANYQGSMEFLHGLKKKLQDKNRRNLNISHQNTTKIELSASFIFDNLIADYRNSCRQEGIKITIKGTLSPRKSVNNFLLSFGILKELGLDKQVTQEAHPTFDIDYLSTYRTFKFDGSKYKSYEKAQASVEMVEYFDQCFMSNNLKLTDQGRSNLIEVFGEIIGNVEEHSGQDKWFVRGCYNNINHDCGFAIINYGRTIYETLSDHNSTSVDTLRRVEQIVEAKRSIFKKASRLFSRQDEEPLWNVMALQEGISSRRTTQGRDSTRGKGLMDVLDFIGRISGNHERTILTIISGFSQIIVDYTYPIIKTQIPPSNEEWKQIVFNKQKKLLEPQDDSKVRSLDDHFPGTIITGQFNINGEYLTALLRNRGENNEPSNRS